MIMVVEDYYENYKNLSQKDYAVTAQHENRIISNYFSLAMMAYNGKEVKYKEFMIKNRKSIFPDIKWSVE